MGQRRGRSKQRQPKQQKQQKCPQCGQKPLPKDRNACFECRPEYKISVHVTLGRDIATGQDKPQSIVQTYENEKQKNVSFAWQISGQCVEIVSENDPRWQGVGFCILDHDSSHKDRTATFHIIGGPADIQEVKIPATATKKKERFKPDQADTNKRPIENLLGR